MYSTLTTKMYSTLSKDTSPLQLIEKAQTFSEDDDLLSPFDTGDVERQMKRAWWKTCSLFTFLLATLGIIIFIIVRDSNGSDGSDGGDSKNELETLPTTSTLTETTTNTNTMKQDSSFTISSLAQRGELPSSKALTNVGARATIRKLYAPYAEHCVDSIFSTLVENGELSNERITLNNVENGFYHILDEFAGVLMKQHSTIKEYLTKSSELGYYSSKLNVDFALNSFTVNAKSDALVFLISINWESIFGNKLPYITNKVITMQYEYKHCEITNLMPISFEECFNGKCNQVLERDSVVVSYLKELIKERFDDKL